MYLLLKKNWNVDKPYEIVGEPERPYLKEKKAKKVVSEEEFSEEEEPKKDEE